MLKLKKKKDILNEQAKKADNCKDWLHICKAECCRMFRIPELALKQGRLVNGWFKFRYRLTKDQTKYFKLHGVAVEHGIISIPYEEHNKPIPVKINDKVYLQFILRCRWLADDNLCKYNEQKPEICRTFDETGQSKQKGVFITKNCLARFKN